MIRKYGFWKISFAAFIFASQNADAQTCGHLDNLEIFVGSWQEINEDITTLEVWDRVSSNTIEGKGSIFAKSGNMTNSESLRIVEMADEVFYIAKVAENAMPISFKLMRGEENRFEFENSQHDFPKKISYFFRSPTTVQVHVSDEDGAGFEINFQKLK
jgi:hypothetical protein